MCGIFGYVGKGNGVQIAIEGLKRLEYRGYDSAGIGGLRDGEIVFAKEVGKVSILEQEVKQMHFHSNTVIAHTRWATHGVPSKANAHPQFDTAHTLALVHNGIIENHESLRKMLISKGFVFSSQTDTEVVAQLIAYHNRGNLLDAIREVLPQLRGSYAFAIIHKDYPEHIFAVAKDMPLIVGLGEDELFLSSDTHACSSHTRNVFYLVDGEIAVLNKVKVEVYTSGLERVEKSMETLSSLIEQVEKGDFSHFTLKEIHEQPQALRNAIANRFIEEFGSATFEDSGLQPESLADIHRIIIVACGTSWHAGSVAQYMIEDMARVPVSVEIASELRYKNPIVEAGTLVIAISQSGETADTLAAVRELRAKGALIIALCNVQGSALTREADHTIFLHAGPEIGVCSTKAYTNQVAILALLALLLARQRHMSREEGIQFLKALVQLPDALHRVLALTPQIEEVAKNYQQFDNYFFIGRRYMYPASLEGALKLKEISYINANGYAAGELKHGPIALITDKCPVVALAANKKTYDKMLSNLMEVKARHGKIIAIVNSSAQDIDEVADEVIRIPDTRDELAAILVGVATQLLAYYIAKERGTEIDQPRNLAKSVTVE